MQKTMRIEVKVRPNSRTEEVVEEENGTFTVKVRQPPSEGRANRAVISLLAKHLGLHESQISIVKGLRSRNKVIEITQADRR